MVTDKEEGWVDDGMGNVWKSEGHLTDLQLGALIFLPTEEADLCVKM